jgi:hypothetical protein
MDYFPMLWNGNFDAPGIVAFLKANPAIHYLLVLNEPNVGGQAWLTPQQAAALWPQYEAVAKQARVKIVGPQMTWGTMTGYTDPVVWLDAFYAAYEAANHNRAPHIDYLGFHWYDYGLDAQLDRIDKDVFRYAWFTGRVSPDPHFSSLLGSPGVLTPLGQLYLTLPFGG